MSTTTRQTPAAAALEPMIDLVGFARHLGISRRKFERLRAAGRIPPPDLTIGRMSRWEASTVREWKASTQEV